MLKIVLLAEERKPRIGVGLQELFDGLEKPTFRIFPLTIEVAREAGAIGDALRDPADRVIVATARVHRLRLLTADQRIIASGLVPVIE